MVCATYCFLGVCSVVLSLLEMCHIHIATGRAQGALEGFQQEIDGYAGHEMLAVSLWKPPANYKCVAKGKRPIVLDSTS